ncbi:hypothetical protein DID80_04415 [Candidatus Marinamargulisbacteria bacterium SCGC AAA071-K20]|nr:hypothetical protein DID80_04415 [Candidatus Marinamargulisbacteria bacterium SCGC AAA071-K20]
MGLSIQTLKDTLDSLLPKSRFEHSLRVADMAVVLASLNNISTEKAYLAGLIHDTAKPMSPQTLLSDYSVQIKDPLETVFSEYKAVWHALVAPQVVSTLFQINDEAVLDAIQWHTTGKADMAFLTKVIFVADFVEPGRNTDISRAMEIIAKSNIDRACFEISEFSIQKLNKKNNKIHPLTIDCYNHYRSFAKK